MDGNINKYLLEKKISEIINKDNGCTAHFIWDLKPCFRNNPEGSIELKVVTLNPAHSTHFLLHKVFKPIYPDTDIEKITCELLNDIIKVLFQKDKRELMHYAIGWRDTSDSSTRFKTITSYFSGNSFKEIIEKFFFEKNDQNIIIDSIQLLPDS